MGPRRRGLSDIRSFLQAESNERLHRYRERERERVRGEAQPLISQQSSDVAIGKFISLCFLNLRCSIAVVLKLK